MTNKSRMNFLKDKNPGQKCQKRSFCEANIFTDWTRGTVKKMKLLNNLIPRKSLKISKSHDLSKLQN